MRKKTICFFLVGSFFICSGKVFSYSLNAYTGIATEKSIIASTIFKGYPKSEFYTGDISLTYGISSKIELTTYSSFYSDSSENGKGLNYAWIMPRYELFSNNILAIQVQYDESNTKSLVYSPQYHYIYDPENKSFAFIMNIGPTLYQKNNEDNSNLFGLFAPVYKFSNSFNIYLELDPIYQFSSDRKGFYLDILPGFWIGFNNNQYQISTALILKNVINPNHDKIEYGAGLFFSAIF